MTRTHWIAAALFAALGTTAQAQPLQVAPAPRLHIDLAGYKTAREAIRANPKEFNLNAVTNAAPAGYLGVSVGEKNGKPVPAWVSQRMVVVP